MSDVPVISLAGVDHEPDRRDAASDRIDAALAEVGFMAVTDHGIDSRLLDRVMVQTQRLFDLPLSIKERARSTTGTNRGWMGVGSEAQARASGARTPPDLSETFSAGREQPPDPNAPLAERAAFLPNVWPERPPGLREGYLALLDAMDVLAATVLRLVAPPLGLPADFFTSRSDRTMASLRANHYPARDDDPLPGQQRSGAHTVGELLSALTTRQPPISDRHLDAMVE